MSENNYFTESEATAESEAVSESNNGNSHLFTVRTTGGQERVVIRLLETRMNSIRNTKEELETFTDEEIHYAEEEEEEIREEIAVVTRKEETSRR